MLKSLLSIIFLAAFLFSCGDHHRGADGGETVDCSSNSRVDTFVIGLEKTGANGQTLILDAMAPAPPAKDNNAWTVTIQDADGNPVSGATVTVDPKMPDHGHGTPIAAEITAGATEGQYYISKINLWMPGYWEVTIGVDNSMGLSDSFVLKTCIEG